jgi:hypothetical protein
LARQPVRGDGRFEDLLGTSSGLIAELKGSFVLPRATGVTQRVEQRCVL